MFLLESSREEEMFLPCLELLVPTDLLIPGDRSQLSLLYRLWGAWLNHPRKKPGSQMLSISFWKLQFPKVQQEQLFSWDVLAVLVPGRT